jgi:myo-inositol-1(or 4)-monophosphatase
LRAAERTLDADMITLMDLAREAGALAVSYTVDGKTAQAWEKTGGSPVTEADLAVNRLCHATLSTARPDYGWLSEETADDKSARQKQRCWVVDPIDGTRAFMRGNPHWCVGLAIVEDGEAIASVLYAPLLDRFYTARAGQGATLNGQRLSVTTRAHAEGARLIAAEELIERQGWPIPWPEMTIARPKPNSTLLRLALVASGEWDATLILGNKADWDLAAGVVLVTEAGGLATTHRGEALNFNRAIPVQRSLLAAGKALHPLLLAQAESFHLADPQAMYHPAPQAPIKDKSRMTESANKQLLHIVFGGELKSVDVVEFEDLTKIDFVGAFPNYREAYDAWKAAAQRTVDHAEMRYFILHAHRLLDPETGDHHHV